MADTTDATTTDADITVEQRGHVLLIGINRVAKRNSFTVETINAFCRAYERLEDDPELRVGLVFAHGDHFTAGLDLADVAPAVEASGRGLPVPGHVDPWGMTAPPCSKPVVVAVQGYCYTLGVELVLAADVALAADSAVFNQFEVARGIMPFGGATLRFARRCGHGNAMRWMLSAENFGADEALRIGLVQEVTTTDDLFDRSLAVAQRIAAMAPLGVQASLANSRLAEREGDAVATEAVLKASHALFSTEDAAEGVASFIERRDAAFRGR